jgi:protein-S-isoprenylcysteine O-methyltransferase Ste14
MLGLLPLSTRPANQVEFTNQGSEHFFSTAATPEFLLAKQRDSFSGSVLGFRLVLSFEMVVLLPIMALYQFKAHTPGDSLDRRQEGIFILVALRLLGFACFDGFLAFLINPALWNWSTLPLPFWSRLVGVGVIASAGVLIVWTFHNLGKNLTDTVDTREVHSLVLAGPYRWVRHPFYIAMALFVGGISLATGNWFFLITGVALLGLLVIRTSKEEEYLVERFGNEYRRYVQQTPRFLPRFNRSPSN